MFFFTYLSIVEELIKKIACDNDERFKSLNKLLLELPKSVQLHDVARVALQGSNKAEYVWCI